MNGLAALPSLPRSATRGLPAPTALVTLGQRRRYAFTLASALAGERSWVIAVHPAWRVDAPAVRHILAAGWPSVGSAHAVAVSQPAPMPEDAAELFARAVAAAPDGIADLLAVLWAGGWPDAVDAALNTALGEIIFRAGVWASAEAEAASQQAAA